MANILGTYNGLKIVGHRTIEIRMTNIVEYLTDDAEVDEHGLAVWQRVSLGEWSRSFRPAHTGRTRFAGDGCRLRTDEDEYFMKVI